MATPRRITSGATPASLHPIVEAVRQHEFTGPALNANLQLTHRTDHGLLPTRSRPTRTAAQHRPDAINVHVNSASSLFVRLSPEEGATKGEFGHWEVVMQHTVTIIAQTAETATLVEWAKLALSAPKARVLRVTRTLFDTSDRPLALEEIVLALERLPSLAANGGGDIPDIAELAQRHGLALGRATERITIVKATKDVAAHLGIAAGADVMKLDRLVDTAAGDPIEWRVAFRRCEP
jgi:hypothetical protein